MRLRKLAVVFFACAAAAGSLANSAHAESVSPAAGALQSMCEMPESTLGLLKGEWVEIKTRSAKGDSNAQYLRGVFYDCGFEVEVDAVSAILWYRKSAAQDNAKAEFAISLHYRLGIGLDKDRQKALVWVEKAAAQSYAPAQYSLGLAYSNGDGGLAKNPQRAFALVHKAAAQNYVIAQYRLGVYYEHGYGTEPDKAQAATWFLRAADAGDGKSEAICGVYYATGMGVPLSSVESVKWFMLAKHNLDPQSSLYGYASRLLKSVSKHMSREDLHRAQTEAAFWLQQHRDEAAAKGEKDE